MGAAGESEDEDERAEGSAHIKGKRLQFCIRRSLVDQLVSPVLWTQCVRELVGMGVSRVLEVGDSKVVSALARRTEPSLRTETMETFLGQA